MLGTVIEVTTPYYVGVSVAALVRATPGPTKPVGERVVATLNEYLSPLTGGPTTATGGRGTCR